MKNSDCRFDHATNTLTITKAFKAAASKLGTPEYKTILELRRDNPTMKIEVVEKTPKKNDAPKLSYKQMKQFISQCRDAAERMAIYERVFALSQAQRSPYHYAKAWFLDNYANYSDKPEFDDDGFVIVKTKAEMKAEASKAEAAPADTESVVEAA